jgi:hypothetical protein
MLNPPWGSGITISMGGGTSKSETWIIPCTKTIEVGVCSESGCARRILLRCRVNLMVESGLCLKVESPLSTVAAIPRAEQNHSRTSRLTSAIAALVSRTRTPAVKNSTIDVERQRALTIADKTTKDRDRNKVYNKDRERDRHGGSVRDPRSSGRDPTPDRRSHSREKVDDHKKRAGIHGTRRTAKTHEKSDTTSPLIQRGIDQATVSVLKLLIIIPMYARFLMLRRRLMKLTGQTIDCYLLPFLTFRVTLAYLAYMSMSCLTQERGRRTLSMKRRRHGFGRWALNERNVVLRCVVV